MPYLLFLKKRQNLKLLSVANYRWHFKKLLKEAHFESNPGLKKAHNQSNPGLFPFHKHFLSEYRFKS